MFHGILVRNSAGTPTLLFFLPQGHLLPDYATRAVGPQGSAANGLRELMIQEPWFRRACMSFDERTRVKITAILLQSRLG